MGSWRDLVQTGMAKSAAFTTNVANKVHLASCSAASKTAMLAALATPGKSAFLVFADQSAFADYRARFIKKGGVAAIKTNLQSVAVVSHLSGAPNEPKVQAWLVLTFKPAVLVTGETAVGDVKQWKSLIGLALRTKRLVTAKGGLLHTLQGFSNEGRGVTFAFGDSSGAPAPTTREVSKALEDLAQYLYYDCG